MKKIDEAIEKLQEARLKTGDGECQGLIETAIALLEAAKAGPTGNGWDDIPEIAAMLKDEAEPEPTEFIKQLHIHLDAQQQEIERLKAENKRLDRWHDYFAWEREMKKVEAKNVRLTAEKKRLLTPTDCETESGGILCIEQEDKILALTERIARKEKALAVAIKYIGESSSDELAAQYDIKQALKGDTP